MMILPLQVWRTIQTLSEDLETFSVFCEISGIFCILLIHFLKLDPSSVVFGPTRQARSPFRRFGGLKMVKGSVVRELILGFFGSGL